MKKLILLMMVMLTFAGLSAVLLNESFTGTTFPPADWSAPATAWERYTSSFNTTPACAKAGYSNGTWWLVTPKLKPVAGANTLTFWYADYSSDAVWDYSNEYTYVMVSTSLDFSAGTILWTGDYTTFTTTWQQASVSLSAYNNTEIYVAFKSVHTGGNYRFIDDVTGVDLAPTGPPNPAVLISPTPSGVTGIQPSATLNWSSGGGAPTGYKIQYGTNAAADNILPLTDVLTATSYDPPGMLTYGQTYYWKVVPYNASGNCTSPSVWSFTVLPAINSFPYVQNFDAVVTPALPTGWSTSEGTAGASYHWATTTTASHGPAAAASLSNYAWLYCYLASTTYNPYNLITPPLVLDATPKRFMYKYWIGTDSYTNPLFVDISTDLTTWTTLYTHVNTMNTLAWFDNTIDLTAYASQTVFVRFRGVSNYGYNMTDFGIDDVVVSDFPAGAPVAPTLTYPLAQSNLPVTGFNLTWSPDPTSGPIDYFNVYLWEDGQSIGDGPIWSTTGTSLNPTNPPLDPDGNPQTPLAFGYLDRYNWTVEAYSSAYPLQMAWPTESWFEIMADPTITTFPYIQNFETWPPAGWDLTGGTYSFVQYTDATPNNWARANFWGQTSGNTDIMTTPPFLSSQNMQVSFLWSHMYHATYPNDALTVQISSNGTTWADLWYKSLTDLESADGAGSTTPGTGMNTTIQIPPSYNGAPFYLRFYGYSGYGPDLFIDNVTVSEALAHDVGASSVTVNKVYAPGVAAAPQALVVNNGINTETFQVNLATTGYSNTQTVTALAPGASATVTFADIPVAQNMYYVATVTTLLGTDMYAGNNTATADFICVNLNTQAYAYVAYDPTSVLGGPATFNLATPGTITDLPGATSSTNFLSGGDWMDDHWYGTEYDDGTLATDNYWKINHTTGGMTNLGASGVALHSMAFNAGTNTLFAGSDANLYTLDPATGVATLVGAFGTGGTMIGLACDHANNILYGMDLGTDNLYTINQTTGAATLVGPFGIDLNYAQDMAFDQLHGYIFLAGYTTFGALYWVNPSNGAAWEIGPFQSNAEIDAFAIPYLSDVPQVTIGADGTISWTAIAGATYYTIWSADDPYGTFNFVTNVGSEYTSFLDPTFGAAKKFYKVTSNNGITRRNLDFSNIPAKPAVRDLREARTGSYTPEK